MKLLNDFALIFLLVGSQQLFAAGPTEHKYTPKEQIEFAPSTTLAFDHSGRTVTYSTLADGSQVAELNGSMGNVTVARLGPGGTVETLCTQDEATARVWMAGEGGTQTVAAVEAPPIVTK